jgi:hypothetical protein
VATVSCAARNHPSTLPARTQPVPSPHANLHLLAQSQCNACIEQWIDQCETECPTCPLCRHAVNGHHEDVPLAAVALPERSTASAPVALSGRMFDWVRLDSSRVISDASIRLRSEDEHRRRQEARERRLHMERRIESYMSFTPSGRPYASLPIISPSQLKELHMSNRRSIGGALKNVARHL